MLSIKHNIALKAYNTLAIDVFARYYITIDNNKQLPEALAFAKQQHLPILILGGGSNIVLTQNFPGLVINIALQGMTFTQNSSSNHSNQIRVTAAAGECWNTLVQTCLKKGYYGLENLSLIPGSVGAAPIQNIGAYGVEFKQRFESLTGWHCDTQSWKTLTAAQCKFAYRDSIFKGELKNRFIITSVSLLLTSTAQIDTSYEALHAELEKRGLNPGSNTITPQHIAEAVIAIRQRKLPNPDELPNVGSFFKNPTLKQQQFEAIKKNYPSIISYPQADGCFKVAAGWMLEQAGWKGKKQGPVAMHSAQSLVLINEGNASGADVMRLASDIQRDIKQQFGVHLDIEPAVY